MYTRGSRARDRATARLCAHLEGEPGPAQKGSKRPGNSKNCSHVSNLWTIAPLRAIIAPSAGMPARCLEPAKTDTQRGY